MPTYRLFVTEEDDEKLVSIPQTAIDESPALKAILERSFTAARTSADGSQIAYEQSYGQSSTHSRLVDRPDNGPHSRSYSKQLA